MKRVGLTAAFRAERSSALIRFLTVEPRLRYVKEQRRYSDHHCTDDVQHPIRYLVRMPGSRFPAVGKFVNLRIPYPMGFYAKGMDGRIDDAQAGWKGRGLWTTFGNRTPFHVEGGKGTMPKVVRFQLRPDPLAR